MSFLSLYAVCPTQLCPNNRHQTDDHVRPLSLSYIPCVIVILVLLPAFRTFAHLQDGHPLMLDGPN